MQWFISFAFPSCCQAVFAQHNEQTQQAQHLKKMYRIGSMRPGVKSTLRELNKLLSDVSCSNAKCDKEALREHASEQ